DHDGRRAAARRRRLHQGISRRALHARGESTADRGRHESGSTYGHRQEHLTMGLIKIELENIMYNQTSREAGWSVLQDFLKDMDADRSSFFHLPEKSTWNEELAAIQPKLATRVPQVDTFIHLGIGGSALGAETIVKGLAGPTAPTFHF